MRRLFAALCLMLSGFDAWAEDSVWDGLQVHGFASQAAIKTSDNRFFGDSPDTSFAFTEIGINASLPVNPQILLAGQVLSRRAGDLYDGTPALDYGLADVTFASSVEQRWGVRLGRIKNPLGLYNETRDVPFTHPGIFLPQVVYFDKIRNQLLSTDGLMLYGEWRGDQGAVSFTVGGGQSVADENAKWTYLPLSYRFESEFKQKDPAALFSLWYATPNERFKFGLSGMALELQLHPGPGSPLNAGTVEFFYGIASLQYNAENWTLSAEYVYEPIEWRNIFFPYMKSTVESYYLQGTYRLRPDLEALLRYEAYANPDDRDGTKTSAITGGLIPPFNTFSKIWTVGLRWDINPQWMVRAEYQRHHGTFILSARENPDLRELQEDWNLFAIQAAFRF